MLTITAHAIERMRQREIDINKEEITMEYIKKLPFYTDNGCYKYLDTKKQVVYYIRKKKDEVYLLETIIKTNKIQMLRNVCDAYKMRCVHLYHPENKCVHCKEWDFNRICRDNLFGTCKRGDSCKYIHKTI